MVRFLKVLSLLGFISMLSACGAEQIGNITDNNIEEGAGSTYTSEGLEGGAVTEITFDDNNQAVVEFDNVSDEARYVLAIYSYNASGSSDAFQLGSSANMTTPQLPGEKESRFASKDLTEDFHDWLRGEEANIEFDQPATPRMATKSETSSSSTEIGAKKSFKVLNSFGGSGGYDTVKAVLIYKSSHFLAWVDERNENSYTDSEWEELLDDYEAKIEDEQALFGVESDVDGNGTYNVLFTQVVNELGGSSGGIVTGFFYAVDLFTSYTQSNQTEILYSFVADPNGEYGTTISKEFALSNIHPSVLVHEYQHMINFNMHYFVNGGSPEMSFLNEALAHLAEDIYSQNSSGYMTETGIENPARVSGYLASIDDLCIVCGASLYQRGGSYLLLRYLYEQAERGNLPAVSSGAQLIDGLLNTSQIGVDNIVLSSYGETESEQRFRDIMGQFGLAVFLSDTGLTSDDRFQIDGIGLRDIQSDNRGTVLQGPSVISAGGNSLNSTIGGASISYVELTSADIENLGGSLGVSLAGEGSVGAYLIQTGI